MDRLAEIQLECSAITSPSQFGRRFANTLVSTILSQLLTHDRSGLIINTRVVNERDGRPVLAIIVPCFDEELILPDTVEALTNCLSGLVQRELIAKSSFVCFVDDGSSDKSWSIIKRFASQNELVEGLKLSRNFGHQQALLAGMLEAKERCDCLISIDADLQQDEKAIAEFLQKFDEGAEIVYGIRKNRSTDNIFKKASAEFFYSLMSVMGVNIHRNHADFRLMSRKALDALQRYDEGNLFLRGIVPDLGFRQSAVYFDVRDRGKGDSKYTLKRMLSFALNGITSFSITPLRLVTALGFLFTLLSILMAGYILVMKLVYETAAPGWASVVMPIYLLGGIQLLSIGVIGEYVGRIYMESKGRPRYLVEDSTLG